MSKVSRVLSYVSAFASVWLLFRSPPGPVGGVVWLPKLWAGAWAPFVAIMGGLGALAGLMRDDRKAMRVGLVGAIVAMRYTAGVTEDHDGFEQAFGPGWETRIPGDLKALMLPDRYRLVQAKPPVVPGRRDVVVGTRTSNGQALLADIWEPPEDVQRTGLEVMYLHGGLWDSLDKDYLTQPLFRRLAGQGHVVMDVAYSRIPEANLSDMMGDVKQAIGWIKSHAAEYGVDPERIVLLGASGGGQLALLAAYTPNHPAFQMDGTGTDTPVRAAISLFAPTDLAAFFHEYGQANPRQPEYSSQITDDMRPRVHDATLIDKLMTRTRTFPAYRQGNMPGGPLTLIHLLGGTLNEVPDSYRLGSPLAHVGAHCPPTLQMFGDDDFAVNVSHARRLHEALQEAGVPSVYVEYPGAVHGFDQYFGVSRRVAPAAQAATHDIERFLALMV